ncbi:MAG: NUDIX hydrolase [Acidimicrobiales bacterium]
MDFRLVAEEVLCTGSVVTMSRATIEGPAGESFERDIVHHPGAVVVVPLLEDPTGQGSKPWVVLVRQYRAAVDAWLLELPAGKRDVAGEPPELAARRELEEEVGMSAGRLREIAQFYNSPGFCDEHTHLYLAQDLTPCEQSPQGVEEGHMTIERVTLDEAFDMVGRGEIVDAKTVVGITMVAFGVARESPSSRL